MEIIFFNILNSFLMTIGPIIDAILKHFLGLNMYENKFLFYFNRILLDI
jgi:hypothetical protein